MKLSVGLNSIADIKVANNKPLSLVFGADTALDSYLDDLMLRIQGVLKPGLKIGTTSAHTKPISLGNGVSLRNTTFIVEGTNDHPIYHLDSTLVLMTNSVPRNITLGVHGIIGNNSFRLIGKLDHFAIGMKNPVWVKDITVNVVGVRDVKNNITVTGSLAATVTIGQFSTSFKMGFPFTQKDSQNVVSFTLGEMAINPHFKLTDLKGTLSNQYPYFNLAGNGVLNTAASDVTFGIEASYSQAGKWSFSGSISNWHVNVSDHGLTIQNVHVTLSEDSGVMDVDFSGDVSLNGYEAKAKVIFSHQLGPIINLSLTKTYTVTAGDIAKSVSNIPSVSSSSASAHSKILGTPLPLDTITINLDLTKQSLNIDGLVSISNSGDLKNVEYHLISSPNKFAAGFMVLKNFKFSEVVSNQSGFDDLTFKSGAFALANNVEKFEFSKKTIQTVNGIVFEAEFETPVVSDNNPSIDATVRGVLTADGSNVSLTGTLDHMHVGPYIALNSCSVTLQTSEPHISMTCGATFNIGSQSLSMKTSISYGTDPTSHKPSMNFQAELPKWTLKSHKSISWNNVKFDLVDNGKGFSGDIGGTLTFGSINISAKLSYPLNDQTHLDFYAPDIKLSDKTHLKNVELHLTETSGTNVKFSATLGESIGSKTMLSIPVSGTFSETSFVIDGTLKEWDIAKTDMKGFNCHLHVKGNLLHGEPVNVSGEMDMDMKLFGGELKAKLPFPLKNNDISLSVSGLHLSKDAILDGTMDLHFDTAGDYKNMTIAGNLAVHLSSKSVVNMKASGTFTTNTYDISAEVDNLKLGSIGGRQLVLDQVLFHLAKTSASTDPTGKLSAKMNIDDITLDVEIDYPLSNLEIELKIPNIRLTKHAKLTNVEFDFNQGDKKIDLKGILDLDFDKSTALHDLALNFEGSIVGDQMHIQTSSSKWIIPVGHNGLTVTNFLATADTTTKDSASHTKVTLSGDVALSTKSDLNLNGTFDSTTDVVTLDLAFKNGESSTLSGLFAKTVSDPTNHNIPTNIVSALHNTNVREANIHLVTKPWSIGIHGVIRVFGNEDLVIDAKVDKHSDSKWYFTTSVALASDFAFSSVVSSASVMNQFKFEQAILAITNAQSSTIKFNNENVTILDGVLFEALLPTEHLSSLVKEFKIWSHVKVMTFSAAWQKDAHRIEFAGELPKNMPIGKDVTVDGHFIMNLVDGKLDFDIFADAHIKLSHGLPPLDASVEIDIKDGGFTFTGKATEYTVPVGHKGVKLEEIQVKLSDTNAGFSGNIIAKVFFGSVELTAEIQIPCAETQEGVEIILSEKNENVNVKSLLDHTCEHSDSLKVPHDLSAVMQNSLIDAKMVIKTSPLSFEVAADVAAFKDTAVVNIELEIAEIGGSWGFGFGIGISSGFKFSNVMPSYGALKDLPPFLNGGFAFAWQEQPFVYKVGALELSVAKGIAFGARGHTPAAVLKWTGIEFIIFKGAFNFDTDSIHLEADFEMDWHLGNLYFYEAGFFLDIGGAHGFDLGIVCNMMIKFNASNQLRFGIKILFTVEGVILDGYTLDDWKQPFGIKGLTVDHSEVEIGFSYAFVPFMFGISGGLEVGSEKGSMTFYVDPSQDTYVIAAKLNEFNLGKMISDLTNGKISAGFVNTMVGVTFKGLDLELNTSSKPLLFNQQTFQPGFLFKVDEFTLMDVIKGDALVEINQSVGLKVKGHVQPFNFLGNLVQVSGYDGPTKPATLDIEIGGIGSHFLMDGRIKILNMIDAGAKIAIQDAHCNIDADFKSGALDFVFQLRANTAHIAKPADFSMFGEVNVSAKTDFISDITNKLKNVLSVIEQKLNAATQKYNDWKTHDEPKLIANEKKINQLLTQKATGLSAAQKALNASYSHFQSVSANVKKIEAHYKHLQSERHHCKWYDAGCQTKQSIIASQIAAEYTTYKSAEATLSVAKHSYEAAQRSYAAQQKAAASVDPTVAALRTQDATIQATGNVARSQLAAAQKTTNDLGLLARWGMKRVMNVFQIKRAYFSAASVKGAHASGVVKMGIDAVFFDKSEHWEIDVQLPLNMNNIHQQLWNYVHGHLPK
eukprot:TRINITY_DN228_c0_g1_i1.p1 TRINITY_DN228_c0_g1~~TRINITY_DN228_c0_g1_i1.p1  ORF type:complete len:2244 (+),score=810.53 TRINITY_DN228_c0_g1_i1:561-6734(+)